MLQHILYGDGIHDDQPAIQEMIDSGLCEISLPAPEKFYLIKRAITIRSGVKLRFPRFSHPPCRWRKLLHAAKRNGVQARKAYA